MEIDQRRADLHIHTLASDGADTPEEVLIEARQAGLTAIAITDHDSVESIAEAVALAPSYGVEMIPGVELSVELDDNELHLLGYFIDYQDQDFCRQLDYLQHTRVQRAERMLELLAGMGFPLDMEELLPPDQMTGAVGRLHIALALTRAGYVRSPGEAFARYIGNDGPANVQKAKLGIAEAIEMVLQAGGAPVLAHPSQLDRDDLIPEMVDLGLVGLETYYPSHSRATINHYEELARFYGLLATGGSDSHGKNRPSVRIGCATVPYTVVDQLRARAAGDTPSPEEIGWGEG